MQDANFIGIIPKNKGSFINSDAINTVVNIICFIGFKPREGIDKAKLI